MEMLFQKQVGIRHSCDDELVPSALEKMLCIK